MMMSDRSVDAKFYWLSTHNLIDKFRLRFELDNDNFGAIQMGRNSIKQSVAVTVRTYRSTHVWSNVTHQFRE